MCTVYPRIKTCTFCQRKKPSRFTSIFTVDFVVKQAVHGDEKKSTTENMQALYVRRQKKTTRDLHKLLRETSHSYLEKKRDIRTLIARINKTGGGQGEEENVSARKTDRNVVNLLGFFCFIVLFHITKKKGGDGVYGGCCCYYWRITIEIKRHRGTNI